MILRQLWPLLFFIVPLIEIFLLIEVGSYIGAGMTVLIVIVTAGIGVTLLRQQGLRTMIRANQAMQQGQMPAKELFDGFLLAIVGVLLLTPGFLTDTIGFLLLMPGVRAAVLQAAMRHMTVQTIGSAHVYRADSGPARPSQENKSDRHTLDGEYWKDD